MNCNSNKYVNLVTLIMVCIIFVQINVLTIMIFSLKKIEVEVEKEELLSNTSIVNTQEWKLKIPKIDVEAKIKEGTDENIINNSIGHFEETQYLEGNIGLVAGCNGYKENYFSRLEELQQGDVIIYEYGGNTKQYKVNLNEVIDQKDWSYLSDTKENKITLITGIKDNQEKRRCVQAIEI